MLYFKLSKANISDRIFVYLLLSNAPDVAKNRRLCQSIYQQNALEK